MDPLSSLVRLARLEGTLDVRCLLAGAHVLDNPARPFGEVPFHLLLDGHCRVEVGGHESDGRRGEGAGREIDMRAGDVVVLPRAGRHRVRVVADGPPVPAVPHAGGAAETLRSAGTPEIDLFCGHFTYRPGAGAALFAGLPDILHASLGPSLRPLSDLMRAEATADGPGAGALLASLCEALLTLALRGAPATASLATPWTAVTDPGLRAMIGAVVREPGRRWTITALAGVAGVSRATLVRHFSAATGLSVADFVTRTRVMIASDLLATTEWGLDDIAARVGYRSASAFGKAFREATGTTPGRLRKDPLTRTDRTRSRPAWPR